MIAPGWYPNPTGDGSRYWDGEKWGYHIVGARRAGVASAAIWALVAVGVAILLVVGGCAALIASNARDRQERQLPAPSVTQTTIVPSPDLPWPIPRPG